MLGFILGPLMEENLRRALISRAATRWCSSRRPISLTLLIIAALLLLLVVLPAFRKTRAGGVHGGVARMHPHTDRGDRSRLGVGSCLATFHSWQLRTAVGFG